MSTPRDTDNPGTHYVYRCYAEDDLLLYVGCTDDIAGRMYHHLALCNRGKIPNSLLNRYMVRHTATAFPSRLAARAAEREAITAEAPLLNRQHNPVRFRKGAGGRYFLVAPVHPLTEEAFGELLERAGVTNGRCNCSDCATLPPVDSAEHTARLEAVDGAA